MPTLAPWLQTLLKSLLAAFAGGAFTALSEAALLGLPTDPAGWYNLRARAIFGGVVAVLGLLTKSPLHKPGSKLLLVALLPLAFSGCGSLLQGQMRLGGEPRISPRPETVLDRVCAGDEAGAMAYLSGTEYRLSDGARADWLAQARAAMAAGKCKCPVEGKCGGK